MFWDDEDNILKNVYVQDWRYFGKYFSENLLAGAGLLSNLWRPLVLFSHSLEWHLWQNWAVGYHLTNICLHLANTFLVFFLLKRWLKKPFLAWGVAIFFLVHPIQTESITYVSGRGDVLSAFFVLLGLFFYTETKFSLSFLNRRLFYLLTLGSYFLALLTKEISIVFPLYLLMVEIFVWQEKNKDKTQYYLNLSFRLLPFFLMSAVYLFLRATVLNFQNTFNLYNEATFYTVHLSVRIFTFLKVLIIYFGLLFCPNNLHMERTIEIPASFLSAPVMLGAVVLIGLISFSLFSWRRQSKYSLAIFWFLVGLIPTSGILVPINNLLSEHWLYFPIIGFCLFWGLAASSLIRKFPRLNLPIGISVSILAVFFLILTIRRNADWRTPITFYENVLQYNQKSVRIWNNLGMAYIKAGETEKALRAYQKAIELDTKQESAATYHNLAILYQTLGQTEKAIKNYENALNIDGKFIFSYFPLANLYLEQKEPSLAISVLKKAAKIFPDNKEFKNALLFLEKENF